MKDSYCSFCGTKYGEPLRYPRTCANAACKVQVWANPIPVSVVLAPVEHEGRTGLLVVRRSIEPRSGLLALTGGFLEEHETWQVGGAREVREETGITIDPGTLEAFWYTSTEPRPNRVLLFSVAKPIASRGFPAFAPSNETSERGLVFGPDGLSDVFAFPLHTRAVERYFASRGVKGPHGFTRV